MSTWTMTVPGDWKEPGLSSREKRSRYYCSREWGLLKESVRARCGGVCERCRIRPMYAVHHLTYARLYREELADLLAVCDPCHEFLHGKRGRDPALPETIPTPDRPERLVEGDVVVHPQFGIGRIARIWRADEHQIHPGADRADIVFAVGPPRTFVLMLAPLKRAEREAVTNDGR